MSKVEVSVDTITVNDVTYYSTPQQPKPNGKRAVVVVDRGWIFAGDVTRENGRIKLTRAIHVFRWDSVKFDGMLANPKSDKVTLRPISDVDIPEGSEIFCVPVSDNWGL